MSYHFVCGLTSFKSSTIRSVVMRALKPTADTTWHSNLLHACFSITNQTRAASNKRWRLTFNVTQCLESVAVTGQQHCIWPLHGFTQYCVVHTGWSDETDASTPVESNKVDAIHHRVGQQSGKTKSRQSHRKCSRFLVVMSQRLVERIIKSNSQDYRSCAWRINDFLAHAASRGVPERNTLLDHTTWKMGQISE